MEANYSFPVQLWCWIDWEWNSLRIYSYYAPIWVCIFLSACIYIAVGYHVFHQRNQLRNLTPSNLAKEISCSDVRDSAEKVNSAPAPDSGYLLLLLAPRDVFLKLEKIGAGHI